MNASIISGPYGFSVEREPWGRVIAAWGELDIAATPDLRQRVEEALDDGTQRLLLDLGGVTFIDSIALAAIVAAKRRLGPDGRLAIASHHSYVLLILKATALDSVLAVYPSRAAAEEALRD